MSKKIIISVVAVVILALIGGGAVWYFKQSNKPVNPPVTENDPGQNASTTTENVDTSNWLTYRNEEYGFEFRYPKDFIANESKVATWVTIDLFSGNEKKFTISNKPQGVETANFFDIATINNQQYKRFVNSLNYNQYIVILNDNFYIVYQFVDDNEKKMIDIILNSFHYID